MGPAYLLCAAVTFAAASLPRPAVAQLFVPTGKDTLRGLPGVEVIVEPLQPEIERAGLTRAAIRAEVMRRLGNGGVRVYTTQVENASPAKPYVYVNVNALELPRAAGYAVAVQVQVRQTLRSVVTESSIVDALTWDALTVLHVRRDTLSAAQPAIDQFVDQFIADWKAVH